MRTLTGIKLINWHFFSDENVEIENSTLITGDNGAGKSTLIDALQVVLVANLAKMKFNSSAFDEKTNRDIRGYLKGKTGVEGETDYLRDKEDFTTYIVLEITHTKSNTPYLIGVLFDYYQSREDFEHVFFRIDNEKSRDELFYKEDSTPRNRREFFHYLKARDVKYKQYKNDLSGYMNDLRQLFGGVKESFFSLIQKGISFTPITNLRGFVYDYILEERHVDVYTMREYFERFRQLERLIEETKREMTKLSEINEVYEELSKKENNAKTADYMIKRATLQEKINHKEARVNELSEEERKLSELLQEIDEKQAKKTSLEDKRREVNEEIANNNTTLQIKSLEQEIKNKEEKLKELKETSKNLTHRLKSEAGEFQKLQEILRAAEEEANDTDTKERETTIAAAKAKKEENEEAPEKEESKFLQYRKLKEMADDFDYLAEILGQKSDEKKEAAPNEIELSNTHSALTKEFNSSLSYSLDEINSLWRQVYTELNERLFNLNNQKEELRETKTRLEGEIKELEKNQILKSSSSTMELKKILEENLSKENGEPVEVDILCEAIDIKNKDWQNAIEGYLHTQKFDLLVEPGYFDEALTLYERYKFTNRLENVGLVNTDKLISTSIKTRDGALSEEITAEKDHILAYTDFLLGQLIKCENENELKKHRRAITKSCMLYQNYTARQIPEKRYKPPYIGKEAVRIQLKEKKEELENIKNQLNSLNKQILNLSEIKNLSGDSKEDRLKSLESDYNKVAEMNELEKELENLNQQRLSIDTSELDRLKEKEKELRDEYDSLDKETGRLQAKEGQKREKINSLKEQVEALEKEKEGAEKDLQELTGEETRLKDWQKKWEKEIKNKSPETLKQNYERTKKRLATEIEKDKASLLKLRSDFNHEFNFSADPTAENNEAYERRYQVLEESHLAEYEEQATEVREKAEQSFREHFVAKLRENIELAREEINELNRALQDMKFGSDSYKFKISAKPELKNYYDMIMDPKLHEGHNLFSESFREEHGEAINELFREISADEETFQEKMQELTDYRSYLDFEIEITDEKGNKSNFSKVAREKSGGETQVPFYVAILASFYQTYGMYRKTDTLRLVVFDEAFNRMDADRVEEAIRFIKTLGFQPLIVAPTGRIQLITPHVHTNLIVMKEGFTSFVESVSRKELLEDESQAPEAPEEPEEASF